jgi:hypothetical protein
MKITKSKLRQIIKEVVEEAEVLDFTSFKRKKEKTWNQPELFVVVMRDDPILYEIDQLRYVTVYNDDQYDALMQAVEDRDKSYKKARELGVQFLPILKK